VGEQVSFEREQPHLKTQAEIAAYNVFFFSKRPARRRLAVASPFRATPGPST
jgi:hypothetical protein